MSLFDKANALLDNLVQASEKTGFLWTTSQGSEWGGLNPHLVALFYPVSPQGAGESRIWVKSGAVQVHAPILEGAEFEYQLNWQSPFENTGTESKAPALTAMLQSGILSQAYTHFTGASDGQTAEGDVSAISENLQYLEGRTGITKLNSTQTFAGMPPIKCTMKLLFRAWQNPEKEVMQPIRTLLRWAMPQELSPDGALINLFEAAKTATDKKKWLDVLMPSKAPQIIAMQYKGRIYSPMVIESISDPITSPTTIDGKYARAEVNLTLSSLTAWDKGDISRIYGGGR